MENTTLLSLLENVSTFFVQENTSAIVAQHDAFAEMQRESKNYMTYKIGDFINNYYFPVLLPVGIVGNILSFLVMVQPHNRHSSMSLYLAAIAVVDTVELVHGSIVLLSLGYGVEIPMEPYWYCAVSMMIFFTFSLCGNLFILSMTFERFYSIIQPHKAASFNTVKRAKFTIVCIVIVSVIFNIPHIYVSYNIGWLCLPFGHPEVMSRSYAMVYYWTSFCAQYACPFVLLLTMNSVIINTLRQRSKFKGRQEVTTTGQGQGQSKAKGKSTDGQVFAILLLVTFGFLILTSPGYLFFVINLEVDFMTSARRMAGYHLFTNAAQKLHYTNHGINFFFYVISGQKFKNDLKRLFGIKPSNAKDSSSSSSSADTDTKMSTVDGGAKKR